MVGLKPDWRGEMDPLDVHGVFGQWAIGWQLTFSLPGLHQQVCLQDLSHPACVDVWVEIIERFSYTRHHKGLTTQPTDVSCLMCLKKCMVIVFFNCRNAAICWYLCISSANGGSGTDGVLHGRPQWRRMCGSFHRRWRLMSEHGFFCMVSDNYKKKMKGLNKNRR